ncbi:TPA: ATP-binding protein, partial [Clostridioides difficile]
NMLIYEGTKYDFKMDMDLDKIPHLLEEKLYERMHIHTSKKEVTSWKNSLQYMYKVLNDPTIPDTCGVAIEYNIPKTNKRVDFIMSGYNHDGKASAIIIELKQWERVETVFNREDLINTEVMTALGKGVHRVVHPCYQAWSYVQHMNDYIEEVGKKDI